MPETPTYLLPYPDPTDPADVPLDLRELAEATESTLGTFDTRIDATEAFDPRLDALEASTVSLDARLDTIEPTVPTARIAPGSNGDVLTTVAGAPAWAAASGGGGRVLIEQKLLAAPAASFNFIGIAAAYRDLELVCYLRGDQAGFTGTTLRLNGDVAANYDAATVKEGAYGFLAGSGFWACGETLHLAATAGRFSLLTASLYGYALTNHMKQLQLDHGFADPAGGRKLIMTGTWRGLAAVNRVELSIAGGNFIAGSFARLYGIA